MKTTGEPATDKIVAAAQRAADERKARAAADPVIVDMLTVAHRRFRLWRLCADRCCRRARACRGDALACGARRWPAVRAWLEEMMQARRRGPAVRRLTHLREWSEEDGVLVQSRKVYFGWRLPADTKP